MLLSSCEDVTSLERERLDGSAFTGQKVEIASCIVYMVNVSQKRIPWHVDPLAGSIPDKFPVPREGLGRCRGVISAFLSLFLLPTNARALCTSHLEKM